MNFIGERYYKINRRLLLLVGLWPNKHLIYKYCQMIFCNIVVIITMICQITKLIIVKRHDVIFMKLLSPITICVIYLIKYQTFFILARKIRYLMDHVETDWNILKDKKEIEIMEKYTYIGSMCTFYLTILGYVAMIFCLFMPLIPSIFDIIGLLNVSSPRQFIFPGEYFIDEQKYFYVILLQVEVTIGLILITLIGTESLYITYIQHACGMFQVASYRINQAFNDKLLQSHIFEKQTIMICKKIIDAIYIHNRAIDFSEFLWSSLAISYSTLLIIGITSLIIHLFCLLQAVLFIKDFDEIITLILFTFGHILYLFVGNYVGQILIDHSANIFQNTYIAQWQNAPLQAQKLLLLIMQRSMRSCKMIVGGMFVPSLEGFVTLMSTTLSYFTVLWSIHK